MEQTRRAMLTGAVSTGACLAAFPLLAAPAGLRRGQASQFGPHPGIDDPLIEFTHWQAQLGQSVTLAAHGRTYNARIAEVIPSRGSGAPATLQDRNWLRQPFSVRLELDSPSGPRGDTLFHLGKSIGSSRQLFAHPATSLSNKAVVVAFFG